MSKSLKVIFAGTPEFAAVALQALLDSAHQVIAVYTQPDRPAGRGLKLKPSPVKELAIANALAVHQPPSLKNNEAQAEMAAYQTDVLVVAAYGLLLPAAVLQIPKYGCINIHPSLLPRWRGAAPIQRTIFAGDQETGVTIMQMDEGLDTGPMLLQQTFKLTNEETSHTLHDQLAKQGASALIETLNLLADNQLQPVKQDNALATYATKITKEEATIDWNLSAQELSQRIRAFNPWPVAFTTWQNQTLRIWLAKELTQSTNATPGTLINASREGLDIATGKGVLRLLQVQLPGGKTQSIADFYNSQHDKLISGKPFN